MQGFTYYDYIYYKKYLKTEEKYITGLRDVDQEYKLEINKENQDYDKTYRMILGDREEASKLINRTLKLGKYNLNENDIEKYTNRFITNDYKNRETDIVFKKKDENIFFLIEHQSKIDYSMPYRLLIYNTEIIRSAINEKKLNTKGYKLPVVYPIVLYTGKKKWDVKKYLEQCQMHLKGCQARPYTGYYLVDVNNYEENYLLNENDFLSKILLLEKAITNQTLENSLQKIIDSNLNDKQKVMLSKIIYYTLSRKIGKERAELYVKKLENKEENQMSALEEYLERIIDEGIEKGMKKGMKEGMKEGKKEGKKEGEKIARYKIIIEMIKNNLDENTIKVITKINETELEELKRKAIKKV